MTARSEFDRFLRLFDVEAAPRATPQQIAEFERSLDFMMPPPLRACYEICNGGTVRSGLCQLRLSSLQDAAKYEEAAGFMSSPFGCFPVFDSNDSDPICVCCKSPLTGYVVQVRHDGGPRLLFRSLESFLRAANDYVESGEYVHTEDLGRDFDEPDRLASDIVTARQLIEMAKHDTTLKYYQLSSALEFACDLVPDNDVASLAELLDIGEEQVRAHVASRLKRIPSEQARQSLARFEADYEAFVERCYNLLRQEGIRASLQMQHGKPAIRIDPEYEIPEKVALVLGWPLWVSTEAFYSLRHREDFANYVLDRIRNLISQRIDLR